MAGDEITVSELGERALIERIAQRLPPAPEGEVWSGDDAAVLNSPGPRLLCSTDAMVEAVDFDVSYSTAYDIGWKALAINVSDVAAMGGRPVHAVVSVGLKPQTDVVFVDDLVAGMAAAAARWGVALVGGDISRARELSVTVAIIGVAPDGRAVSRTGAGVGDAICVTGALGGAAAGLLALQRRMEAAPDDVALGRALTRLVSRQRRPQARVEAGQLLGALGATAMIDVSDGLARDLGNLLHASLVGCDVDADAVPIDDDVRVLARALSDESVDPLTLALAGGEDFELLFTIDPRVVQEIRSTLRDDELDVTRIGSVTAGSARIGGRDLSRWEELGWDHLRARRDC